jgi:hypothetical protein
LQFLTTKNVAAERAITQQNELSVDINRMTRKFWFLGALCGKIFLLQLQSVAEKMVHA